MIKTLDTSELETLKGIRIELTDDDRAFLVFTYRRKTVDGKARERVFWLAMAALYGVAGFIMWWVAR